MIYNLHSDQWNLWKVGSQEDHCKDIFKRMCLCRLIFINWKIVVYLCVYLYCQQKEKHSIWELWVSVLFGDHTEGYSPGGGLSVTFRICSKLLYISYMCVCVCVHRKRILTKKYMQSSIHLDRRLLLVMRNRYLS